MDQVAATSAGFWNRTEQFAARRPWRCALLLTPLLFALLAMIFRPAYETNDDAAMSMIAAGKLIATSPDEHLVFTHPMIGLALKGLYTLAPKMPWYGLYLLATQVAAHTVIAGLLLLYCPPRRALAWFAFWLTTVGVYFITHLQFTTTAFLAGMAGVLLLWEAARRVCERVAATPGTAAVQCARPVLGLLIAGGALVLWCEMIRWYMFYLIVMMPLPAIGIWWLWKQPGWRITAQAAGVAALVILGGYGLKEMHLAYYHADPEWRDFYEYNELRAQFNDTVKVVYNDQTRASFEQAGWTAIDMQMMSSWCYEDATIFSREKLQQIWGSRAWHAERRSLKLAWYEMYPLLFASEMRVPLFLLVILTFLVPLDRRHLSFNTVVVGTAFSTILLLSFVQKVPPPRVYMPIMVWAVVASAWNFLNRSLVRPGTRPALTLLEVCQKLVVLPFRHGTPVHGWAHTNGILVPVCAVLVGLIVTLQQHRQFHKQRSAAQRQLRDDIRAFQPEASKLYVLWGASIPMEDLAPLKSFAELNDLHLLWFGWPQQMPAHRAMKARYGITNLMQEWPEHPEVQAICPPICTEFYANYAKAHYAQEVRAVPAGTLMGNTIFQFQKAGGDAVAEKPRVTSQVE
jgi:hypothetical protein